MLRKLQRTIQGITWTHYYWWKSVPINVSSYSPLIALVGVEWWASGQITPKHSTLAYWIFKAGIQENRSRKVTQTFPWTFSPRTDHKHLIWEVPFYTWRKNKHALVGLPQFMTVTSYYLFFHNCPLFIKLGIKILRSHCLFRSQFHYEDSHVMYWLIQSHVKQINVYAFLLFICLYQFNFQTHPGTLWMLRETFFPPIRESIQIKTRKIIWSEKNTN